MKNIKLRDPIFSVLLVNCVFVLIGAAVGHLPINAIDFKAKYNFFDSQNFLNAVDKGVGKFKKIIKTSYLITLKIGNCKAFFDAQRTELGLPEISSSIAVSNTIQTGNSGLSTPTQSSSLTEASNQQPPDTTQNQNEIQPNQEVSPADSNLNEFNQEIKAIGAPTRTYKMEKLSTTKNYKKKILRI